MMTARIWRINEGAEAENDKQAGLTACPRCGTMVVNRARALRVHEEECDGTQPQGAAPV